MFTMGGVDKPGGLARVDVLADEAMKEGIVDVKLMHRPITRCSQGKHGVDRGGFDDGAKRFAVVDAGALGEAADNPSCLVPIKGAVLLVLVAENPLPTDDMGTGRSWNELPGLVGLESVELGLHGCTPVGVLKSSIDRCGNG